MALQARTGPHAHRAHHKDDDWLIVEIADTGPVSRRDPQARVRAVLHHEGVARHRPRPASLGVVVNRHHGDLTVVESEPGNTRFQVRLPLTEVT